MKLAVLHGWITGCKKFCTQGEKNVAEPKYTGNIL
jgi:hypothetical protein